MHNPVRSCIFTPQLTKFFDKNPNNVRPLGLRVSGDVSGVGFSQKNYLVTSVPSTPPWHLFSPTVDLSLSTLNKCITSPEIYHSKFLEICEGLQDFYHIYTDGSKMNDLTAAAAVGRDVSKSLRINGQASIFTAELVALNLSLDIMRRSKHKKFAIFSDSLSSLLAIHNRRLETGYVQKFITEYTQLSNSGKTIILIWIPNHIGIRGNEHADDAVKATLNRTSCATIYLITMHLIILCV